MSTAPSTHLAQVSANCGSSCALAGAQTLRTLYGRMLADKPLAARNSGDFAYLKKPV
ncbi:hypothetical protein [uncultured Desulfovibrio sp.]|uniref:hypothetical protein n=1 Tax=uncultured Desulfovibrio sp. TaxID=167968 RepID=UPI002605111E|nr:hypothetical protein [uncultured Desulfovibrio sp.]